MPSVKVLNQSDARPWHLQERLPSTGAWRIVLFVGDVVGSAAQRAKMTGLCDRLAAPDSLLRRFTPPSAARDAVFEVLTVHAAPRTEVSIHDFPEVLRPYDELDGWDYDKIFVDSESFHEGFGRAYESFGIDPLVGCAIVVRPDQYVSYVGPVENYQALDDFFSAFMISHS